MQEKIKTVSISPGSTELARVFDLAKTERSVRLRIGSDVFTITYESSSLSQEAREFLTRGGTVNE
jgi:hypothetical protein